ncbi:type II toxin-antitoxin system Phd/YefM family antitoxin [Tritonibacter mobilis]|uniref:type II toxin-antitoxin system Phd/YefM family antitoxin n=1 Tax=Tritonibacter mobilis TaxID=379347 RepID=UPI001C09DC03|nr:type II toxin-antitoxin system prevent-host-death family antitoxin [Tritonibacter mobilis]MBU3035942.1 type II toxin-antitoxin system prevent-host-death family antitoxin [Tritonibacter mobilis]WHQ85362.1 type II toxin-antitoxin system prevent-host-death family antitoxin [Tritonibacter mobilis]
MDVVNYSAARADLKNLMDRVTTGHEEIVISRSKGEAVVMVSLEDWNAQQETNYLLSSPKNAQRLRESISELAAGGGKKVAGDFFE